MALMHINFHSRTLGMASSMDVLVPDPKRDDKGRVQLGRPHQVLYLLHGLGDDHTIWQRRTSIERYVAGLDLVVVMPNGHRSFYTDQAHGLRYWTFLSDELPALVRNWLPVSDAREDTFAAGLSMGGYGAFKLALRCPKRFCAAASLSGALDIAARVDEMPEIDVWDATFGDANPRASDDDLFALASKLATSRAPKPRLFQWCGTEDVLYADNVKFRDHARKVKFDLDYSESPGDHRWAYWDEQIRHALDWLRVRRLD